MKNKRLFVLTLLFVIVTVIETILIIHLLTSNREEPKKEKTVEEIKENEEIKKLRSMPYKHGNLLEITYYNDDESTGKIDELVFKKITSSYHLYTYERKQTGEKTIIKEYMVDPPEYTKILNYMAEYNLPAWSTLKDKEGKDVSNKKFKFVFNDSAYNKSKTEAYLVGFNKELPDGGHKILSEYINILYNSIQEKNILNTTIKN